MFRNRWAALLFVAVTLAGVTKLVGTSEDGGAIQHAAEEIAHQKEQAERLTDDMSSPSSISAAQPSAPMLADEDLIDPAVGEDPTPIDEFAAANPENAVLADDQQVVIVSRDVAGASQETAVEQ